MSGHPSYGVVTPEVFNKAVNSFGFGEAQRILRDVDPNFFKDERGASYSWWAAEIKLNGCYSMEVDVYARSEAEAIHLTLKEFREHNGKIWEQMDAQIFEEAESIEVFEVWEALL